MKAIYTRTIGVYDEKLGEAMEISKGCLLYTSDAADES